MLNCIFYALFFTLFVTFSTGSLRMSQVNRVFTECYKGMFEASLISVDTNGEPVVPYYDIATVNKYVVNYLEPNIKRYVTDYSLTTNYYVSKEGSVCKSNMQCRSVVIKLMAKINILFKYDKSLNFYVNERGGK